jgi:hypothetical protein
VLRNTTRLDQFLTTVCRGESKIWLSK